MKTGYSTLKGQLIRSIIFPKELGFQFYVDAMKFVAMLFGLAAIGMVYCIYLYATRGVSFLLHPLKTLMLYRLNKTMVFLGALDSSPSQSS